MQDPHKKRARLGRNPHAPHRSPCCHLPSAICRLPSSVSCQQSGGTSQSAKRPNSSLPSFGSFEPQAVIPFKHCLHRSPLSQLSSYVPMLQGTESHCLLE